jgi:hypothetical protein
VHFVIQGDPNGAWHVSAWNGTTETPMYYAGRIAALDDGTARTFVIQIDRTASTLVIRFPDGSTMGRLCVTESAICQDHLCIAVRPPVGPRCSRGGR